MKIIDNLIKKERSFYKKQADEVFCRMEHFKNSQFSDKLFLGEGAKSLKPFFSIRLSPQDLPKKKFDLKNFIQKRISCGIRFF